MAHGTSTISVSKALKRELEEARGDREMMEFLQHLLSEWRKAQAAPRPAAPLRELQNLGPALGPALDVMKPWSMKITSEGITVEEIRPGGSRGKMDDPPSPASQEVPAQVPAEPRPKGSMYQSWSFELKDPPAPPPAETHPVREVSPTPRTAKGPKRKKKTSPSSSA